jgi:hypothetical protein
MMEQGLTAIEVLDTLKLMVILLDCLLCVALCFNESIFLLSNEYTAGPTFLKLAYHQSYYSINVHQMLLKSSLITYAPHSFIQLLNSKHYAIKSFNLAISKSFLKLFNIIGTN